MRNGGHVRRYGDPIQTLIHPVKAIISATVSIGATFFEGAYLTSPKLCKLFLQPRASSSALTFASPKGANPVFHFIISTAFPTLVIVAALRDTTTMTIPNWLCGLGAVMFFPVVFAAGLAPTAAAAAVALGILALLAGISMFAAGWIGGGDAKLFAVCGLWLGWQEALPFVVWTAVAGGGLAIVLLQLRKLVISWPQRGPSWWARLMTPGGDVPYGIAIAMGALATFPESPVMQALQTTRIV